MKLAERISLIGFKSAWWAGSNLPKSFLVTLFVGLAKIGVAKQPQSFKQLKFNIAQVLGEPVDSETVAKISRKSFLNYARYWAEMFSLISVPNEKLHDYIDLQGIELLDAALARGKGVLVIAPHSGNWDLAGAAIAHRHGSLMTVAERLKPEELFQLFVKSREPRGIEILPHRGGEIPAFDSMLKRLREGGFVALATDRDMSRSGVEVEFFGNRAKVPSGPARLFQESGCTVLAVKVFFNGKKTIIDFQPSLSLTGNIQQDAQIMTTEIERVIKANPDNWFMLQRVFVDRSDKSTGGKE
jgi:KDO2-lipid IV(A) lauroyltransferase